MSIEVEIIKPKIGARIKATPEDLRDPAVLARILEMLEDRVVLVFPQLNLSDEQQIELTEALGPGWKFQNEGVEGAPKAQTPSLHQVTLDHQVALDLKNGLNVERSADRRRLSIRGTYYWHIDGLTREAEPDKLQLLSCRATSARGGQTHFANTYAAYESLLPEEKAEIEDMVVEHSLYGSARHAVAIPTPEDIALWRGDFPPIRHRLVKTKPSGRKSLMIGVTADFIVGMPVYEGRPYLARLTEAASQDQFVYRHQWSVGDLVVCDNSGALHRVTPYGEDSGRKVNHTRVLGVSNAA